MTEKRDYYDVLEISRNASDGDITKAFRSLARKYHPDKNKDNESAAVRFRRATEAMDKLMDSLHVFLLAK